MKKVLPLLLVVASCVPLAAQTVPPALMVKQGDKSEPLGLSRYESQVRIFGYVAETTTTMTFTNPMPRVLEGDLYFPLPEGATVAGYALDIAGKMIDGVAVEKHEARRVFESVVRQGIDPGLVEWTKGNNFHTRVFPIPAHGSRTVRLTYVTELIGDKEGVSYHLPLAFTKPVHDFSVRVEVVKATVAPRIKQGELANFSFTKWRDSFVAEAKLTDAAPHKGLVIALPEVEKQSVLVEKVEDGQVYFAIHDFPAPAEAEQAAAAPRHVVLYWDASGSRGRGDRSREIGLARACFEAWTAAPGAGPIEVDLVLFRDVQAKPKQLSITRSNINHLVRELEMVAYDGGTQMAAISPAPHAKRPDFYLLFTDGISDFGREEPDALGAPVYIFSSDETANHSFLHHLAMTNGGRYFNLVRMKDAAVVPAVGRPAFSFLSAKAADNQAAAMYPELPQPIAGPFSLVGKLSGDKAQVTLSYGIVGGKAQPRKFTVSRGDAAEGTLLSRLWAQKKLADLAVFPKRNEKEIIALGKQFNMVTQFTSLRVLGHRLQQLGYLDLAVLTFEQVLRLRPEEPQSYRDLALVLATRAHQTVWKQATEEQAARFAAAKRDDYARAIHLLSDVVLKDWDSRFPEIEVIALEELNATLPSARQAGVSDVPVDRRLLKLLDVDIRIVMTWHADNTDMDLWVTEPSDERAFYGHNRTTIGGLVSRDFTQGYGPEEYMVRKAMHGMYKIQTNYFGSRAARLVGPVTVQVDVYTNFGRSNQQRKSLTLRLKEARDTVTIGEIEF